MDNSTTRSRFALRDLGRLGYEAAREMQDEACARVLKARESGDQTLAAGEILAVEHDPVITISKRAGAAQHVIGSPEMLAERGIRVVATDRGGDVTYHGPGQQVIYPIVDLNRLGLRIHGYMRCLEQAVIDTLASFGVHGRRDPAATGVWVDTDDPGAGLGGDRDTAPADPARLAKVCAMGVRVRRWVTLHGLALNVRTDLDHFTTINPCGLSRPVSSLAELLGGRCPSMDDVRTRLMDAVADELSAPTVAVAQPPVSGSGASG